MTFDAHDQDAARRPRGVLAKNAQRSKTVKVLSSNPKRETRPERSLNF
jgi:hypothetical protein